MALVIGLTGPVPILIYPSDVAVYLDACHDVSRHLVLGRDFMCPVGPTALLPSALAMRAGQSTVGALSTGAVLAWIAYAALAWNTARSRMNSWIAVCFSLFVAGSACAPYTLDFGGWRVLSYGMSYNRLAWAALCIAAVPAFLRPGPAAGNTSWVAFAQGACATWLILNKPNYILIQGPLALWALMSDTESRHHPMRAAAWLIVGVVFTAAAVWCCVPYDPLGIAKELLAMAGGAPGDLLIYTLKRSLSENWIPLSLLAISWGAFAWHPAPGAAQSAAWSPLILIAAVIFAVFAANMTNCQFAEFPIWGALGWILAASCKREPGRRPLARVLMAVGILLGVAYSWQPLASIPYAFLEKRIHLPKSGGATFVASPAWTGMPMRYYPGENFASSLDPSGSAADYANWLSDGVALLNRMRPHSGRVLCLDWNNPYPFALKSDPVSGDQVAWHVGRTLGLRHHPDAGRLLAQADVVMEPKTSLQPLSLEFKRSLFAPGLKADFAIGGESECWKIWVRRKKGGAAPL